MAENHPAHPDHPVTRDFAQGAEGDRLFAPAAARNSEPIGDLMQAVAPTHGRALELASGTGQHVAMLARLMPGLSWQPSEIDPARRRSIDAYAADTGLGNIRRAAQIDAVTHGWATRHGLQDLIFLSNLLHLISRSEADTLIEEVAHALAPGGIFVLYGPFKRAGELTSEGDARFHAQLVAADPRTGYKDDFDVIEMLHANWLELDRVVEMPANNLAFVARRPNGMAL
ncbi:DUF938 domain-containing protein [Pseudooceanicola sp. 216_PA32_1]|uniref:DUF938 domain-containing protein n=1 Tax=Pseudooceanicola pacificus TaxID=2676438 RepID=A0A844WFE3_9RHOB|nr:DUF938 domain-containing protein [Pseudooceanicola pacificus]MWB79812.1 DUF938 domain-containing protein [Pseudooceanicola pacificus]